MRVIKRNGEEEEVSFDKVLNRIRNLSDNLNVDIFDIAQKVCSRIYDNVKTSELDELTAQICSSLIIENPDYGTLSSRIIISNHHKNTSPSFSETIMLLYSNNGSTPLVSDKLYDIVMKNKEKLNVYIDYSRDYLFDYFGFKTLERAYLLKINKKVTERPQHMFMRVALGIHGYDFKDALQTYDYMSKKYFTHATPTLFNAGTPRPQNSSCFLLGIPEDSVNSIFNTLTECAHISKYSGGIGLHIHDIRANGSVIRGTNGYSDGILPMLKVYNNAAVYINQCFTPDTMVYTMEGNKRMDEVTKEDYLVTHDGSFKKVNSISKNYVDKDILEIRTKFSFETVKLTNEHEIYAITDQQKILNYKVIKNRLDKKIVEPKFILAKDLTENDMVGYPIPSYVKDVDIDADYCRFYGIMIGDGSIHKRKNSMEYKVYLNNTTKKPTSEFIEKYLTDKNIHYWVTIGKNDINTYSIGWSDKSIDIKYDDLYDINGEKHIHSKFINLPEDKTLSLIKGLMESDGHNNKELYFHSTSYQVSMVMRYVLLRLGILSSGYIKDDIGKSHYITRKDGKQDYIETKKIMYVIRIPKDIKLSNVLNFKPNKYRNYFVYNDIIWSRINNIKTIKYQGDVYDFNMTDNHNYTVASLGLVHNSGKRNGSFAVYLEPWHADVEVFVDMKKNHGNEDDRARDLFYALWIPDLFMERVKADEMWSLMCPDKCRGLSDVYGNEFKILYEKYESEKKYNKQIKAQDLWFKILETQIETGVPYILFKDAANKKSNQKNLGTIKSSNLCVAPDTMILTEEGYYPIKDLKDKEVKVWNGSEFSETTVKQTGVMQKLITIKFDNGIDLKCTPYHKFYISENDEIKIIEAQNLQLDMNIIKYDLPVINSDKTIKYAYTQGLYASDKNIETDFSKRHKYTISIHKNSRDLIKYIEWIYSIETDEYINLSIPDDIREKNFVPINYNIETKIKWLEGYLDGDGYVNVSNIVIPHLNLEFLKNIQLLLHTLGIHTCIIKNELIIDSKGVYKLIDHGFNPKKFNIPNSIKYEQSIIRVSAIIDNDELNDTYCFNEPKEHKGIFNGILTGQCCEIMQYTSAEEIAVCNLSSICLGTFVSIIDDVPVFDFEKLHEITMIVTKNLNKIIDVNFYPLEKARNSNLRHRPIGIGVQGLADAFILMRYPFDSPEAIQLNKDIFETIYHGALQESMLISKKRTELYYESKKIEKSSDRYKEISKHLDWESTIEPFTTCYPGSYSSFIGSPVYHGQLQFDMWDVTPSDKYDWNTLKKDIAEHGIRNSLLLAPMPTASTSQIMGFNEAAEPFTSNIYKRKTLAGEFVMLNKYLVNDLIKLDLWTKDIRNKLMISEGSVQNIPDIPDDIKKLYKTVWEISQKTIIDMAADRGAFVCQSQSMNLFLEDPDFKKITSMLFYSWSKGLKTGCYYLRSKPKSKSQMFTIDPSLSKYANLKEEKKKKVVCTDTVCTMCSG
jgi:ribonucleoside-diphosphate reductase alpha chain